MNIKRHYIDFFNDILESIKKIEQFTKGMNYNQFATDDKTSYAVIRALEIIGEAAKEIPKKIKEENQELPWKEMSGMRDKLIHVYFGVNREVVWETIEEDIPKLKPIIAQIIKEMDKNQLE